MSFDRHMLINACAQHGVVARVVVASVRGSAPREVGASMLVWDKGMSGTIGGGTLEFSAIKAARSVEKPGYRHLSKHALGPDMGQCCGGAVELLTEVFDLKMAQSLPQDLIARGPGKMPFAVARLKAQGRNASGTPAAQLIAGWMVEPVTEPTRLVWIWGAGHVGRALVDVLRPLPDIQITWVDTAHDRFPNPVPSGIEQIIAADPASLVRYAPPNAEHLIVTYSHTLDLELCHRLLDHGFNFAGLIGSATKWARFRSRLTALGHAPSQIAQITCPIGKPQLGKHPQAIAVGVASTLLMAEQKKPHLMEDTA